MGKFKLSKLVPVGIGLLTFAGFVGSISGSLAWWAYSTRVSVSYQGTSVSTSEQLQIGLKLDKTNPNIATMTSELVALGLEDDTDYVDPLGTGDYRYLFAKAGGGLPADAIQTYLREEGTYAINELAPVTSRTYTIGGAFNLYESLIAGHEVNDADAETSKYVYLPFVFRIQKLNAVGEDDRYAADRDIYMSNSRAIASSDNPDSKIAHALRIYVEGTNDFILNPNPELDTNNGSTDVCGLLDLSPDCMYDTYIDGPNAGKEIIYGDYEVSGVTSTFVQEDEPTVLTNINQVELPGSFDYEDIEGGRSTFLAAHPKGATCYTNFTGITKGVAQYKTMKAIRPDSTHAQLTGGESLCRTAGEAGKYLAELDLTIWLEGWDHEVVDTALSHKFQLDLQFQIDLVS